MMTYIKKKSIFGIIVLMLCSLVACSGGGNSDPVDPVTTYSLSGNITVGGGLATDSDNNELVGVFADNSSFSNAQSIDNVVSVNGFVTYSPTEVSGDRFETEADRDDFYQVFLQAGQVIRLDVADFDFDNRFDQDIDIFLYDLDLNEIATSETVTNFEEIQVVDEGEYYIRVKAYYGASKYVLRLAATTTTADFDPMRNLHTKDLIPNQAIAKYAIDENLSATLSTASKPVGDPRPSMVLIDLDDDLSISSSRSPRYLASQSQLTDAEYELKTRNPESFQKRQTLNRIKQMQLSGEFEYVSPNFMRRIQRVPDDTFYNSQWHYPAMNLPQAWDITTGTPANGDVIVAVIDSGVVLAHEDLDGQLVTGYDFISDPANALDGDGIDGDPDDPGDSTIIGQSSWHGTHVAGTVAAASNNGLGVAGVSWGAKIMPLRVCGEAGCALFDTLQAVQFAAGLSNNSPITLPVEERADIINLSLGGFGFSAAAADVYQQVADLGIIIVAAAGNENTSALSYPASYSGVFSVSALNYQGGKASYSNFGTAVDIAAPGGDSGDLNGDGFFDGVASTIVDDRNNDRISAYGFQAGTSMASPHVAGMFALMKATYPDLTPEDIESQLMLGNLTTDIGQAGRDDLFGYGAADAYSAVLAAQNLAGNTVVDPVVSASPTNIVLNANSTAIVNLDNIGGGTPMLVDSKTSDNWLSVSAENVDAEGLGDYRITVDRTGLQDGFYSGTVTFEFNTASDVSVSVSMTVGELANSSTTSQLYGLLLNENIDQVIANANIAQNNNSISYSFDEISEGSYYIVVGSDVDNNFITCEYGEVCGIYPTNSSAVLVNVSEDLTNLDVSVEVLSNLSPLSLIRDDYVTNLLSRNSKEEAVVPELMIIPEK